jgi:hypothetical protein
MTWPSWRCAWPRIGPRKVPLDPSRRSIWPANPPCGGGGWLCFHGLSLICIVALEQGEHKCLVRGVLIHRLHARQIRGSPQGSSWLEGDDSRLTDGFATSRAKTFGGMVIRPDTILASSFASLLYLRGDVIELDAVELVLEGPYGVAICLHLVIVATRVLHDLVNHELRVPPDVDAFDACLDGNSEATKEGLILCHVVGRREVQTHRVPHMFPEG